MTSKYQQMLNEYYRRKQIHPEHFNCPNQFVCRKYAHQGNMTEAKMSMVGSLYGAGYPKIVVISLDPPSGSKKSKNERWEFLEPHQRTTDYISAVHEGDDYDREIANPHWAMTQIIVKDILELWGYRAKPGAAVVTESYSGRYKENVSAYFVHVNVAKCSMNNDGQRQAHEKVHAACSRLYLRGELVLLEPDILITQGAATNKILGRMLVGREILVQELPKTEQVALGEEQVLWMPMHHPTQQLEKIRNCWPKYMRAARHWEKNI
jgi:hypothetical protein